jgi:N-acetylmuramoyl-L-alanine amidase
LAWCLGLCLVLGMALSPAVAAPLATVRLFGYDQKTGDVVLYSNRPLSVKGFHLDTPERWVVDFENAKYVGSTETVGAIAGTPVTRVRVGQFKGGIVRVVFDLSRRAEFRPVLEGPGGSIRYAFKVGSPGTAVSQALPTPFPMRTPTPLRTPRVPRVTPRQAVPEPGSSGLSLRRKGGGWQLSLTTQQAFSYTVMPKTRSDRLVFEISGGGSELPRDSLYVDNGLIARVRVLPQGRRSRVIVEFDQPLRIAVAQSANHHTLQLTLGAVAEATHHDPHSRRVTIDAGHGGDDPGTIGVDGVREKDVTLQMALRLQRLMKASGMEVQMTRTKDTQILLHPRVDIGDAFDSDVFISIHANHSDNPRTAGIETYYFTPRSLALARAVHRKLVRTLHRPDRGIRRNNFVVVKYNKMPACLVEIGYLSNHKEEHLLTNARYQQRAAEAIVAGVQDYFRYRQMRQ